jgi:membrane protein YqaA with SNARE-associated domain
MTSPLPPSEPPAVPQSWYRTLYARVQGYAETKYAVAAFTGVAFLDASVFPVPPFALMVPMVLAQPRSWLKLSALGIVSSVVGGLAGYGLGSGVHGVLELLHMDLSVPLQGAAAERLGVAGQSVGGLLGSNIWVLILLASVLPTPFKLVAIGSGVVQVPLARFLLAALVGRSARFLLVGLACRFGGEQARRWLKS